MRSKFYKASLYITFALLSFACARGDIITATVVVTNAANLNGTNSASLTYSGDTRIWTNTVLTANVATQIKASTNTSTAAFRLLQHLLSFPFSGVQTSATNNGIVLTGADGAALSLTVSNSWASVAYRTNTVTTPAVVMRAPRSSEGTLERAIGDDRVIDGINNAPTNTVSTSAASMAAFATVATSQTISGDKNFTGKNTLPNFTLTYSSQSPDSGTTNYVADLTGNAYRTITPTADVNFLQSTNRASSAGRTVVFLIYPNGTNRNLTVNTSWHALAPVDAVLTNTTIGVLSVTCLGTTETNVFYSFKAVP